MNVVQVEKKQLVEMQLNFLGCPSLAIPVLEKTYYPKFLWFTSLEALKEGLSKVKPLIVLDASDKPVTSDKVPPALRNQETVYCVRAWEGIPERDWNIIRNNICEPTDHNFTFKWDTENYSDAVITAAKKRQADAERQAREYDKKELEEHMTNHKNGGKRHPLLRT